MRPTRLALLLVAASAAVALPRPALAGEGDAPLDPDAALASPAPRHPERWGLHSGDTAGPGGTILYGEMGWPDTSLGFQHGVSTYVDVGFRASFLYGIDYVVPKKRNSTDLAPGLGLTIPVRVTVARSDRLSLLVHADPGVKFDGFERKIYFGPQIPLGVDLGLHLSARSTLTLGADLPISLRVTPTADGITAFIPLLMGLTFESRFTDHFGMSFNLRTGIVHGINRTGSDTDLGLLGQVGFLGRI